MKKLLPKYKVSSKGGGRVDLRKVANGVFYVFGTSCPWNAVPREFVAESTVHRWEKRGVFRRPWKSSLHIQILSNG